MYLKTLARIRVPEEQLSKKVHEFWQLDSDWAWHLFDSFLPSSTLLKLASTIVSDAVDDEDKLVWGEDLNGVFTVNKACKELCNFSSQGGLSG